MSSNAVRKGDLSSGHGCYPPTKVKNGSETVFINGKPAFRKGDFWQKHCCGEFCHDPFSTEGSEKVFVEGIPLVRVGDKSEFANGGMGLENCGIIATTGSDNVFAG